MFYPPQGKVGARDGEECRSVSEEDESRQAYRELFEYMQRLDDEYLSEARREAEADDVAESEHMLLQLLKAAIDVWVDNDPGRPRFTPLAGLTLKRGGVGARRTRRTAPLSTLRVPTAFGGE
jgi:hypothetical protein